MRKIFISLAMVMGVMPMARAEAALSQPNIILVVSDDQRWDTIDEMGRVQSDLVAKGVNFTNAHVTTPLCCPARSSILTGQYTHTHGVWGNNPPYGGFPRFNDDRTIATVLQGAGYRTGLFGKYLNNYPDKDDMTYIPPGWDQWRGITSDGADFYDYTLNENGTLVDYGRQPSDYLTDVLFNHVGDFVSRALADTQPFFAYVTPVAPHEHAVPEADYEDDFADIAPWRPASYNEHDVSDKPLHIRKLEKMNMTERRYSDDFRQRQYETLQSVDEDIGILIDSMSPAQLNNTLIIYTSDNGYFWGEHRLQGKNLPYQEALRAPLVMRWDNAWGQSVSDELATNIDFAPTFTQAAGIGDMPGADGMSLLAAAQGGFDLRDHHVIEGMGRTNVPPWCGIQGRDYTYVRYATGEEEFYNLTADPLQRANRAEQMQNRGKLGPYRRLAKDECVPTPPGFRW